jgi:hypothetical protein
VARYHRTYWQRDLEDPDTPVRRVTLRSLADYLNGDCSGPVKWNKNNVDLFRISREWEEIGYELLIKEGPRWYTLPVPSKISGGY